MQDEDEDEEEEKKEKKKEKKRKADDEVHNHLSATLWSFHYSGACDTHKITALVISFLV
jgi:hypothetical protein